MSTIWSDISNEKINPLENKAISFNDKKVATKNLHIIDFFENEDNENRREDEPSQRIITETIQNLRAKSNDCTNEESSIRKSISDEQTQEECNQKHSEIVSKERRNSSTSISSHSSLISLMKKIDQLKNNYDIKSDLNSYKYSMRDIIDSKKLGRGEVSQSKEEKEEDGCCDEIDQNQCKNETDNPQDLMNGILLNELKANRLPRHSDNCDKIDEDILSNQTMNGEKDASKHSNKRKLIEDGKLLCSKPNSIGYELSSRGRKLNKNPPSQFSLKSESDNDENRRNSEKNSTLDSSLMSDSNTSIGNRGRYKDWSNVNFIRRTLDKLGFHRRETVANKNEKFQAKTQNRTSNMLNSPFNTKNSIAEPNVNSNVAKFDTPLVTRSVSGSPHSRKRRGSSRSSTSSSSRRRKRRFSSSDSSYISRRRRSSMSTYSSKEYCTIKYYRFSILRMIDNLINS